MTDNIDSTVINGETVEEVTPVIEAPEVIAPVIEQEPVIEEVAPEEADTIGKDTLADLVKGYKEQVEELQRQNNELQVTLAEKVTEQATQVQSLETTVTDYISELQATLPPEIAVLMPENITLEAKLEWIKKAQGAVPKPVEIVEEKPVIESIGKPTPVATEPIVETGNQTAQVKLNNFFSGFFGGK